MTRLLRMRKFASGLLLVGVLMAMTSVAATAASSNHSKAKFSAESVILAAGPSHILAGLGLPVPPVLASTDVDVKTKGLVIKNITVHTVNEAVINDFLPPGDGMQVDPCSDNDEGGACGATETLLNDMPALSLHESTARLTKVAVTRVTIDTPLGPYTYETYAGKLRGKLRGAFVIGNPLLPVAAGEAKLKIKGTATYVCFGPDASTPQPSVAFCEAGSPGYDPANLFLPMVLNVVDTGKFEAEPVGEVIVGDHQLVEIKGKLRVTVNAAGRSLLPGSAIEITKAQAKYITP